MLFALPFYMKKIGLLIFCGFYFTGFAQLSGNINLNWSWNQNVSYGNFQLNLPQFDRDKMYFDVQKKQIFFVQMLPSNTFYQPEAMQIQKVVLENVAADALGDLDLTKIPSEIEPQFENIQSRDESFVRLTFNPIIKKNNQYQMVRSLDYQFNPSKAKTQAGTFQNYAIVNSALSSGEWYRFYVQKSGVYKIDKAFLQQLGINVGAINPKNVKLYGNGGKMLPLSNNIDYPNDITENAIQVVGEDDGVFNDSDYILFYAEGVDNWNQESNTFVNLYSDKSYYYINLASDPGKRIQNYQQPIANATQTLNSFDDVVYHEEDLINIGKLGRTWYGESFEVNNDQTFDFNIPNIVPNSSIFSEINLASNGENYTKFNIKINGVSYNDVDLYPIGSSGTYNESNAYNYISATENVSINLKYENNGVPISIGYLNYIKLNCQRYLKGFGKQFRFQLQNQSNSVGLYEIANANNLTQVWDISDIYNVSKITNSNQSLISFKAHLQQNTHFIAIDPSDYYLPLKEAQTRVTNQDLKGSIFKNTNGQFQDIDYLIITPSFLYPQAEKLANFHRNYASLNVKVVPLEQIYQEFASGKQDIGAIRNFVKYVYFNASSNSSKVQYLNLFGDASYDFKNKIPAALNTNIVPIYHALRGNSLGESSFATDDFFGMMDANEGDNFAYGSNGLDVAVGRMIVSSNQQADDMVNKVMAYHDIKSYGSWRNNYVYIADDIDKISDASLEVVQNQVADELWLNKPFMNINKIILDSYLQESSAGGFRYPKAKQDIYNAFEKGALVFNYLGHGGEDGLAQERLWEKSTGQNLFNPNKFPLFITLTCDFSRFDNPYKKTAGEYTYWNPNGGAIAMITTVREVSQAGAEAFNFELNKQLFGFNQSTYPSIGEALRRAKNIASASAKVIFCLGDPALKLAIPQSKIVLTKVNDMPVTGAIDDFKALSYIKLSGEILNESNQFQSTYNGDLAVAIFDKNSQKSTIVNDGIGQVMNFTALGETIFRGNANIVNGKFEFGFVVPRDIRIPLGNGRISFYAKRNQILLDKTGYNTVIKIGGINPNAAADTTPPKVKLYMNDQTFINGGITNESPIFLAYLDDENGINTASGIGHDIIGILDGNETNPYIMNDYYETEPDNYKLGKVKFPFRNLSVGLHTIKFKAWDVYNNIVTAEIQFLVMGNDTLALTNVLNYPNPFVSYTQFWFTHNKPFEPLEVQVQVMTVSGKVVWTHNQTITTEGFLSREISWDGKDDFGDRLGKGVYIYKLTVKSNVSNTKTEKYEKLVIL